LALETVTVDEVAFLDEVAVTDEVPETVLAVVRDGAIDSSAISLDKPNFIIIAGRPFVGSDAAEASTALSLLAAAAATRYTGIVMSAPLSEPASGGNGSAVSDAAIIIAMPPAACTALACIG
jgi:hypothetical protein